LLPTLLALLCLFSAQAKADADPAIDVAVRMQGGEVLVDVNFTCVSRRRRPGR